MTHTASLGIDNPPKTALIRGRRLATGVLVVMAAVFLATHFAGDTTIVRLIRSIAEAGMIGGLADWFAVEALFRRPLGLPIPHTALLPRNQARAARNVGRFFDTHFLDPVKLEQRLRDLRPGTYAIAWLTMPQNTMLVARELTKLLEQVLQFDPSPKTLARLRMWIRQQARQDANDPAIADILARLVKHGVRSTAVDEVLTLVHRAIDQNRNVAAKLVQDQSRWWIASAVDRRVADLAVDGVLSLLDELQNEHSDLRRDFEKAFDVMVDHLSAEGTLAVAVGDARNALVNSGALETALLQLAEGLRDKLHAQIKDNPDLLAIPVAKLIRDFVTRLTSEGTARVVIDAYLAGLLTKLISDLRPAIADYVTDVIADWAPDELTERFEEEIGPDLQYIRINGAVLGSLIGGALFGLNQIIG